MAIASGSERIDRADEELRGVVADVDDVRPVGRKGQVSDRCR